MTAQPVTPWYPAHIKPAHRGYYITRLPGPVRPTLNEWDGWEWWAALGPTRLQDREWCGLTVRP